MAAPILVVSGCSAVGKSTVSRLLAGSLNSSVHFPTDFFLRLFNDPFPDPATPGGAHYYEVVGAAMAAAAAQLAVGGYTVILDGTIFPDGVGGMAEICGRRGAPVHYAVLRATLAACLERAIHRVLAEPPDLDAFRALHAKFAELGEREANVIDASDDPERVAANVLSSFRSGQLGPIPETRQRAGA
jgi:predicted kinase